MVQADRSRTYQRSTAVWLLLDQRSMSLLSKHSNTCHCLLLQS